jgi:hypothetical protein
VIEYLRTDNQVLREKLGRKWILLNDDQRRRLAVKGKILGRRLLAEIGTIFTPDTILRWHRELIAKKSDYNARQSGAGRPAVAKEVVELVVRMASENPTWATTGSRVPCKTWAIRSRMHPSATSCGGAGSSRRPHPAGCELGSDTRLTFIRRRTANASRFRCARVL